MLVDAYGAGVDSQAVVLVLHDSVANSDAGALANIETISVVAAVGVTVRVVNSDAAEDQVVRLDTECLNGRVLDVQAVNGRIVQVMGVEELGLGLAAVGSLAVPPACSPTVDGVVGGTSDTDLRSGDLNQRSVPFLVSEGGLTTEDDLCSELLSASHPILYSFP